jgi:hypothetical protein
MKKPCEACDDSGQLFPMVKQVYSYLGKSAQSAGGLGFIAEPGKRGEKKAGEEPPGDKTK